MQKTFFGYRRENGRVGIRNHVIILPLDDLSNAACEAVATNEGGNLPCPTLMVVYKQFGEDLGFALPHPYWYGLQTRTCCCCGYWVLNRNGPSAVDGIAKTGVPVAGFAIEKNGDLNTICAASRTAKEFVHLTTEYQRVECPVKDLRVSTKCGESDTTSGIASNPTVGNAFDKLWEAATTLFGETTEITGGEHIVLSRCANAEVAQTLPVFL